MKKPSFALIAVFTVCSTAVNCQCPAGCFCLAGYVTCSDLKSVPAVFPEDTRSITISNIDATEIPAGIFDKLPAIESIEIYQGRIGKISTGAFDSLSFLDLITLNELKIGTIEPFAFSNITDIGTISLYMSTIGSIQSYAFWDIFALDEIKLFMIDVERIESFAFNSIDELYIFSFYTNKVGILEPSAFSNFTNVHKLSMYLNSFGSLGCGSIEDLLDETYEHSFYSNSVNCSCDLAWIPSDPSLRKYLYTNWCQVPNTEEKVYWEELSFETLECDVEEKSLCVPPIPSEFSTRPFTLSTKLVSSNKASSVRTSPIGSTVTPIIYSSSTQRSSTVETTSVVHTTRSLFFTLFTKLASSYKASSVRTSPIGSTVTPIMYSTPTPRQSTFETTSVVHTTRSSATSTVPLSNSEKSSTTLRSVSTSLDDSKESVFGSSPVFFSRVSAKQTFKQPSSKPTTKYSKSTSLPITKTETVKVTNIGKQVTSENVQNGHHVVISNETEEVKVVPGLTDTSQKIEAGVVSAEKDSNGSTRLYVCLLLLILVVCLPLI